MDKVQLNILVDCACLEGKDKTLLFPSPDQSRHNKSVLFFLLRLKMLLILLETLGNYYQTTLFGM